jgi:hypothetical protein
MQDYNIKLKRYNGVDYDNLYPQTKTSLLLGNVQKNQLQRGATYTASVVTLLKDVWQADSESITQTVQVDNLLSTDIVIVAPIPENVQVYSYSEIICSEQNNNSLTFKATLQPAEDIDVNILILT